MAKIPVYQVKIPEYKLKKFRKTSENIDHAGTPWYNFKIPKIYADNKPDFEKIGAKIDVCLKKYFLGKKVVIRVLGSEEHKGKSVNDLIRIIKKIGYDRYDPRRKGDRYKNIDNKHIDFFALKYEIKKYGKYFKDFIEPFYYLPIVDRQKPIRVDIAIIYDPNQLEVVEHRYKEREKEIKRDGYVFKNPNNKHNSILGIIKIL